MTGITWKGIITKQKLDDDDMQNLISHFATSSWDGIRFGQKVLCV